MQIAIGLFAVLLAFWTGWLLGWKLGQRRRPKTNDASPRSNDQDQQRMLQLLGDLGDWTDEYSGNITDYQQQLDRLAGDIRSRNAKAGNDPRVDAQQLMSLLEEILGKSMEVQMRLDRAEAELEKRSEQIKFSLSQARTDVMTGLPNRRALDEELELRFEKFRQGGSPFCLALVDVDDFKWVNDSHGHLGGDGVLQRISHRLTHQFPSDSYQRSMVARFGGDEFAVISGETVDSLASRLDALRQEITQFVFQIAETPLRVTLSIGVSQVGDDATPLALVRRADESLYRAKEMGRNCTFYDDGHGPTRVGSADLRQTPRSQN